MFLKILLCVLPPGLAILSGWLYGKYHKYGGIPTWYRLHNYTTITFNHFIDWYSINPDKWEWNRYENNPNHVTYNTDPNSGFVYVGHTDLYWETIKDRRKFKSWLKNCNQTAENDKRKQEYKEVLTDIQKDTEAKLAELKKKNEEEQAEIKKQIKAIQNTPITILPNYEYKSETELKACFTLHESIRNGNKMFMRWEDEWKQVWEDAFGHTYIKLNDGHLKEVYVDGKLSV